MGAANIPPLVVGFNPAEHVLGPTSYNLSYAKVSHPNLPQIAETISSHIDQYGSLSLEEPIIFAAARIRLSNGMLLVQKWPVPDRRAGILASANFDDQGLLQGISAWASFGHNNIISQGTRIFDSGLLQTSLRVDASANLFKQIIQSAELFANANSPMTKSSLLVFDLAFKMYTELLHQAGVERKPSKKAPKEQFGNLYHNMAHSLATGGAAKIWSANMVKMDTLLDSNERGTVLDFSMEHNIRNDKITIQQTHGNGIRETEEDDDGNELAIPKFLPTAPLLENIFKELEKEF